MIGQLPGEKLDIVRWSGSIEEFIRNALAPAKVERIVLDAAAHRATVHASREYFALIHGRQDMRRELVSKLVGWHILVKES
jgi:N utilization substance protein A